MSKSFSRAIVLITAAVVAVLILSSAAFGQCSMCRSALTSANNAFFIRNFNIGVLVLLVPPVTIFCSIFVVLRRYRAADDEDVNQFEAPVSESRSDPQD